MVPVLTLTDEAMAEPLARALLAGGLDVIEITYRSSAASAAIARLRRVLPQLCVLAGTIVEVDQLRAAVAAGAQAIVSPALNPEIVNAARAAGVAMIPGVATATEIDQARRLGISLVKIFPAEQLGGAKYLRALHAVFPQMRFLPTGGLNVAGLRDYAQLDFVVACGLGSIAPGELVDRGRFAQITERATRAREMMRPEARR